MKIKLEGRFLNISLVIFIFFLVLESSAQNFYPLRYGKRDNRVDGRILRGPRYERRSGEDTFYSSRYGKRSPSEEPSENAPNSRSPYKSNEYLPVSNVEYASPEIRDRYERSPESKNRFYIGSRFGKRDGYQSGGGNEEEHILCRRTGIKDLYDCLEELF